MKGEGANPPVHLAGIAVGDECVPNVKGSLCWYVESSIL